MSKFSKRILIALVVVIAVITAFFYFRQQVYFARGGGEGVKKFKIEKGESTALIAKNLESAGFVARGQYFLFYVWAEGLKGKIIAGEYEIGAGLTIPEIATIITSDNTESLQVKITFPEGWTNKEVEARIKNNKLNTDQFQELLKKPEYFQEKYSYEFLKNLLKGATLEGFLFPDTYYFYKDATAEDIIKKMLDNFDQKLSANLRQEIEKQGKSIYAIITMASVIEGEVKTDADREIVSGLFWQRIKSGQALQSCATLAYVLGENKKQYSFADTRTVSPYNTYLNKGLPPGPIANPGLSAIRAAIYPVDSQYNYFLSDPETGKTIFSKTLDEHNANKAKYGL